MPRLTAKTVTILAGIFLLTWLGLRYLFPLVRPFLIGGLLALAAEPAVVFLEKRLRLPRFAASGIGVSVTLVLLSCLLVLLAAFLVREVSLLANALPNLEETAQQGLSTLEELLISLADRSPEGVRPMLQRSVSDFFRDGNALMDQLSKRISAIASAALGHVPGSFLTIGTAILSGFMLSARFRRIREGIRNYLTKAPLQKYMQPLKGIRSAIFGWLYAQLKLSAMSFLIVLTGMLLLKIPYAPLWALLIALVDAVPILGTGTILLPWSLVSLVQGNPLRAIGLLITYLVSMLSRTVMEPRLIGKQLGIDPLITLMALYAGYRIWGIGGMLLAPVLCVAGMELIKARA